MREKRLSRLAEASDGDTRVSFEAWYGVKYLCGRIKVSSLCSYDWTLQKNHLHSFKTFTKGKWQVCGKGPVFWGCMLCPGQPHVHVRTGRQEHGTTLSWCINILNVDFFGLTLMYCMKIFNGTQTKYEKPSKTENKKNASHIKGFRERNMLEDIKGV